MIRQIATLDADQAARLSALHTRTFEGISRGWSAGEIRALAGTGTLLLDESDRGFAIISHALDEAELLTIVVAQNHRRSGLGVSLLQAVMKAATAKGAERLFLEVAADNPAAIALYQKTGFLEIGLRKGYYVRESGKVDALVMAKTL